MPIIDGQKVKIKDMTAEQKRKYNAEKKAESRNKQRIEEMVEGKARPSIMSNTMTIRAFKEMLEDRIKEPSTPAAIMNTYYSLLKDEQARANSLILSPDEIAGMMIQAERELRDEGYL